MSARGITALRWLIVLGYAMTAWGMSHDGLSAGEFGALFVVAAILIPIILTLDWIANGKHAQGDPWDGDW